MKNELFQKKVELMTDEELQVEELTWGKTNAPESDEYLAIVRNVIQGRRGNWGNLDCFKESLRLLNEISENGSYDESLRSKLQRLFTHSYPRINNILSSILGIDPSFPARRGFKDVWGIDETRLDKLLASNTPRFLDGTLERWNNGKTIEKNGREGIAKKLVRLSPFDSHLGEDLTRKRYELLVALKGDYQSNDFQKNLERYFNDVEQQRVAEHRRVGRQDDANRRLEKDYFSETLEPNLRRIRDDLTVQRKITLGTWSVVSEQQVKQKAAQSPLKEIDLDKAIERLFRWWNAKPRKRGKRIARCVKLLDNYRIRGKPDYSPVKLNNALQKRIDKGKSQGLPKR